MGSLFDAALADMGDEMIRPPQKWRDYLTAQGAVSAPPTARVLSVQDLGGLDRGLSDAHVMVFRCGSAGGNGTRFALARAQSWPDDYFLPDDMPDTPPPVFLSPAPNRDLFVFQLVKPVERTLLNLALATGALSELLALDAPGPLAAAATGSTVYDFAFRPLASQPGQLDHAAGQVEVDAVLVAPRGRAEHVFVIEAKYETAAAPRPAARRLAKHKLLFPVLGVRPRVPPGLPIVPVSLRAVVGDGYVDLHCVECEPFAGGASDVLGVDQIKPAAPPTSLRLPMRLG